MASLLERLKLVDTLTIELPIGKNTFVERLKRNVDPGNTGTFLSPFEVFSSSKNDYKGTVTSDTFKIRRRNRLFEMTPCLAVAEGTIGQKEDSLVIEMKIKGFQSIFIFLICFLLVFYAFLLISIIGSDMPGGLAWFTPIFIVLHAAFMFGIPFFMMKRGVSRMKYELERDFYFMTRNQAAVPR